MTSKLEMTPADEWVNEPTLRRRLGYSRSTIRKLRLLGLPHVGTARLRRYPWNEVRAWLSSRS